MTANPSQNTRSLGSIDFADVLAPSRAIRAVRWYQRAFAARQSPCRFFPSCSEYSIEALEIHGTRRGVWLTLRRLLRCRPFGPSGVDLVPPTRRLEADPSHKKAS